MALPERNTARLRHGRVSRPGARYFLTLCTAHRAPVFTTPDRVLPALAALDLMHSQGDIVLHAATLMPDHVHLLFTLGPRLTVGQAMAKFKTFARQRGRADWHWQSDGFEHRLRNEESAEDYAFYIFMNPYRAQLASPAEVWPHWRCPDPARFGFLAHLGPDGAPPAAWLALADEAAARIVTRA